MSESINDVLEEHPFYLKSFRTKNTQLTTKPLNLVNILIGCL